MDKSSDQNSMNPQDLENLLSPDYTPSEDEEFMSPLQRAYFFRKLKNWRESILEDSQDTLEALRNGQREIEDEADAAFVESDQALELRARDRQRKLLNKIDQAIARVLNGSYGYCKQTGNPIGLDRLNARSVAEFSLEGQAMHEQNEQQGNRSV